MALVTFIAYPAQKVDGGTQIEITGAFRKEKVEIKNSVEANAHLEVFADAIQLERKEGFVVSCMWPAGVRKPRGWDSQTPDYVGRFGG